MVSQLIVIDSRLRNHQFVIDQIATGFAVLELDANRDGLGQIADYLSSHSSANAGEAFDAIHLLSHGSAGKVQLGSLTLDSTNLAAEAQTLAKIHSLLAPGADLLVYGCDVAQGAQGSAFVTQLAKISGLDVAASTNLTGGKTGDWVLETTVGQLQARALHLNLQDSLLAGSVIQGTARAETLVGLTGNDTILGLGGDDLIQVTLTGAASKAVVDGGTGTNILSIQGNWTSLAGALPTSLYYSNTTTGYGNWVFSSGDSSVWFTNIFSQNLATGYWSGTAKFASRTYQLLNDATVNALVSYPEYTGDNFMAFMVEGSNKFSLPTITSSLNLLTANKYTLVGTQGADTVTLGAGADQIITQGGNDTIIGGAGNDTIFAGDGDDWTDVGNSTTSFGNDILDGGSGADWISFSKLSSVSLNVNLANHTATSNLGSVALTSIEKVAGTSGADSLTGGDVADKTDAIGNRVTEWLRGNGGNDTLTGGAGADFAAAADYSNNTSGQAVNANLRTGVASDGLDGTDKLVNIDFLVGGAGNDSLTGGSVSRDPSGNFFEIFRGNAGNDTLDGSNSSSDGDYASSDRADYSRNTTTQAINVSLASGQASDGMGGTDTLISIDQVYGGAGNDTLIGGSGGETFDGGAGNDSIDGSAGSDQVRYQQSTAGVIVNLGASSLTVRCKTVAAGSADDGMGGTDTLISIENVRGSDFNDYIRGNDDTSIRQYLTGDAGSDTIDGGLGVDIASYGDTPLYLGGITASLVAGTGGAVQVTDKKGGVDTLINIEGLSGTHSADSLTGSSGNDYLRGQGGSDTLDGGAGNDWVLYNADPGSVTINLQTGQATDGWNGANGLLALGGTDTLKNIENAEGSDFNDSITGSDGDNRLVGRAGNDTLTGGAGNDSLDGGAGRDILDYSQDTGAVTVNLQTQRATDGSGGQDTVVGFEQVIGSAFNDVLTGTTSLNEEGFAGGGGNDTIDGGAITDTLNLSNLNIVSYQAATAAVNVNLDTGLVTGGAGLDVLKNINVVLGSAFNDTLTGSNSADIADLFDGDAGDDVIDGGAGGMDFAMFSKATAGVTASLTSGTASGAGIGTDTLKNIEALSGSDYADVLTGSDNAAGSIEYFLGNAGNDTIDGKGGLDIVYYGSSQAGVKVVLGGSADGSADDALGGTDVLRNMEGVSGSAFNDTLSGSAADEAFTGQKGNDTMDGKGGVDTAYYFRSLEGINVDLSQNIASSDGYGTSDVLLNMENVTGSRDFNDFISGNSGDNRLEGLGGSDTLMGGAGEDTLQGGDGNDVIKITDTGSTDTIDGGAGWDNLYLRMDTGTLTLNGGNILGIESYNLDITTGAGSTAPKVTVSDMAFAAAATTHVSVNAWSASAALSIDASTAAVGHNVRINGGNGNDTLVGGAGDDMLWGNGGDDLLSGGSGNDIAIYYFSQPQLTGLTLSANNGSWTLSSGTTALLKLTADTTNANSAWTVKDLRTTTDAYTGLSGTDTLNGIETIQVEVSGNWDTAANLDLRINAGTPSVTLRDVNNLGTTGNDTLTGTSGNDTISAFIGDDSITALAGDDQISITDNGSTDTVQGGAGWDSLTLGVDGTALTLDGKSNIRGIESFNLYTNGYSGPAPQAVYVSDAFFTLAASDKISVTTRLDYAAVTYVAMTMDAGAVAAGHAVDFTGGNGNDTLIGGSGDDFLTGYNGNDYLMGGYGNDTLASGRGSSTIDGGAGVDTWFGDLGNARIDNASLQGNATTGWNFLLGGYPIGLIKPIVGTGTWTLQPTGSAYSSTLSNIEFMQISGVDANGAPMVLKIAIDSSLTAPTLTIVNRAPTALADLATATEAGGVSNGTVGVNPRGNVLTNDTDPDTGDTKTLFNIKAGVLTTTTATVVASGTTSASGKGVSGTYGGLKIGADGSYVYTVDNTNATVNALNSGSTPLTDTFTYSVKDAAGLFSSTTLTVTINGANDAPVNTLPTATPSTLEDTSKAITGLKINDVDAGSASFSVTLAAANGMLSLGSATGVTVASNNSASVKLTGTLAAINSLLSASKGVTYTPTANFNGSTSLTMTTNDGSGGTDTDTLAITVTPVNDAPTGAVTVSGNAVLNGVLSASNTLADVDVMGNLAYQWLSDGTAISGATASTFKMLAAQVNHSISLKVSYTDGGGTRESVTSGILRVGSAGADTITGLASADTIDGGDGADSISGGDGNDFLTGGKGNDTLDGGAATDTASYASASVAVTINLATTSGKSSSSAANDVAAIGADTLKNLENIIGSGFGDKLTGDADANVLYGKLGNDTLTGGAGADVFVLDTATGSANVDTILDFTSASDKIQLSKAIFTAAGSLGDLASAAFWSGAGVVAGHDANDRFAYNTSNGKLYYDADGNGAGAAVWIATLGTTTYPALLYSDLQIIG